MDVRAFFVLFFCCLTTIERSDDRKSSPIIQTTAGPIQGEILETVVRRQKYYAFKGIPYAAPPVGHLRFKPPIEAKPWTDVKQTIKEGSMCIQFVKRVDKVYGSEDCLFLNVFTPIINTTDLKAVFVYIHGGYFKILSGNSYNLGPDFLLEDGIVVITINYRLGALGLLRLDHDEILGNAALKDQTFALQWVKKNIKNFGGDPDRVTIAGRSSGSACVDLHILSDLSKGLFHRSVALSGSVLNPWAFATPEEAEERAYQLGTLVNNNRSLHSIDELVRVLQNATASDIVRMTELLPTIRPFKPSLENHLIAKNETTFLTECYINKFLSGNYSKVPHMISFTSGEALTYLRDAGMFKKCQDETYEYIKRHSSISSFIRENIENGTFLNKYNSISDLKKLIDVLSEVNYFIGNELKRKIMSETGSQSIYYLRYSFDAKEYSIKQLIDKVHILDGATHADDAVLQFYGRMLGLPLEENHPLSIQRRKYIRLLTNFIKYGNPTPTGEFDPLLNVAWPIAGKLGAYLDFGEQIIAHNHRPFSSEIEQFTDIVKAKLLKGHCCNLQCEV